MSQPPRRKARALIFGGTGQDGSYLGRLLLDKGYDVHVTSRSPAGEICGNHQRLGIASSITRHRLDLTSPDEVEAVMTSVAPDEVYHLGGQTSVRMSFDHPVDSFESIASSLIATLDVVRRLMPDVRVFNACSSEVFGNCTEHATVDTPFRPLSPYGCAKASAFHAVQAFRHGYGLYAANGVLFNHESPLRGPHFVTHKIVREAVEVARGERSRIMLGNIASVRDWGWAPDYVEAMWRILQADAPLDVIIATGQSHSVEAFARSVLDHLGLDWNTCIAIDEHLLRSADVVRSEADASDSLVKLGWKPTVGFDELTKLLIEAELARRG